MALTANGALAALQPSHEFGRVPAAHRGVCIVGSLLCGIAFDGSHPDRFDILGALLYLVGVAVIMYARQAPPTSARARDLPSLRGDPVVSGLWLS
jgi:small multidrug resistance family-3 protein